MTQPGATANNRPTAKEVADFHSNSDVDSAVTAQHHTLGIERNQASSGTHTHDGKNSRKIGKGLDTGFPTTANAAYSQAQMQSVINALRAIGFGT